MVQKSLVEMEESLSSLWGRRDPLRVLEPAHMPQLWADLAEIAQKGS
jgi:hypothetical protein